jgi:pSer/pThr/pTyr-binding forkhead associated (FHA) protein
MVGTPRAAAPVEVAPAGPAAEPLVLKVNGQERVFPQGKVVVGRSRDVDIQIDNADVSRRHAVIYWSEGSVVVKDLGSTNGTMVNGYPIDSTVVRPSDVIRIGNAHITVASR